MVHQGDDAERALRAGERGGEGHARVAELVDDEERAVGEARPGRGDAGALAQGVERAAGGELLEAQVEAARAQAVDDEAIVEVAAGRLIERAVDDPGDPGRRTHARYLLGSSGGGGCRVRPLAGAR